jgi:hypothetical protein
VIDAESDNIKVSRYTSVKSVPFYRVGEFHLTLIPIYALSIQSEQHCVMWRKALPNMYHAVNSML